jgi:hypothetical protein
MRLFVLLCLIFSYDFVFSSYVEDLDDLLMHCNAYNAESVKRTKHICEKELDENFEYFITNLKSHYTGE